MKLTGLQRICRQFGSVKLNGVVHVWDYAKECAIPEAEMKADKERLEKSEQAKWNQAKGC